MLHTLKHTAAGRGIASFLSLTVTTLTLTLPGCNVADPDTVESRTAAVTESGVEISTTNYDGKTSSAETSYEDLISVLTEVAPPFVADGRASADSRVLLTAERVRFTTPDGSEARYRRSGTRYVREGAAEVGARFFEWRGDLTVVRIGTATGVFQIGFSGIQVVAERADVVAGLAALVLGGVTDEEFESTALTGLEAAALLALILAGVWLGCVVAGNLACGITADLNCPHGVASYNHECGVSGSDEGGYGLGDCEYTCMGMPGGGGANPPLDQLGY